MTGRIEVLAVAGLPEVRPGDDLAALIAGAVDLVDGDVVVVTQKVVSKAEDAAVGLLNGNACTEGHGISQQGDAEKGWVRMG